MPKVSAEHLEARKQQILDAALDCFARQGFHRTTMKDIVETSGLSPGAIYNYFASKDDIIDEIARQRHARESALLAEGLSGDHRALTLGELMRAFFAGFAADEHRKSRRVGIEMWAEALRNPSVMKAVRRGVDEPRKILGRIIGECQERGELPASADPEGLAGVMIAIFQGFVLQQAWDTEIDSDRYLASIELLLDSLATKQGESHVR